MFALKNPDEVTALLTGAGFTQVAVERVSTTILLAGGGTLDESLEFLLGMGMVRGLLEDEGRDITVDEIRTAQLKTMYLASACGSAPPVGWLLRTGSAAVLPRPT